MVRSPTRAPATAGVKVTPIVQEALAANETPQLFVSAKSLALVPRTAMRVMLMEALPVFSSVTA